MAEDEYEALPDNASVFSHMLAGACAGIMEHTIIYPVDCVKTRMQCLKPTCEVRYSGVLDGLRKMVRIEGWTGTLRGIGAVVGGAGPAHSLFFASYEFSKRTLRPIIGNDHAAYALSGVVATIFHDAVMTPADAVKQRVQMYNSPYHSSWHCLRSVIAADGVGVLYRAYFTQLLTNLPYQVTHFIAYEAGQDFMNQDRQYRPLTHMLSGAFAGGFASAVTNPLDVCKTVLNTQEQCALAVAPGQQKVRGLVGAARTVFATHGFAGFSRGLRARVVLQVPGAAISWSIYELFKALLRGEKISFSSASAAEAAQADGSGRFPGVVHASSEKQKDEKDKGA